MATENPAFAGAADAPSSEPAVDVEAALKDGTLTAEQAVVVQERQLRDEMARLEAEMEELNAKQDELQQMVDTFDSNRHGYSELASWTEEVEKLASTIATVEERWLALAERA